MILADKKEIKKGEVWKYGYFHSEEFKLSKLPSEDISSFVADGRIIRIVNFMRFKLGFPVVISSFGRSPKYNATLPGASSNSYHLITDKRPVSAIDSHPIDLKRLPEYKRLLLENIAVLKGMGLKGVGFYKNFVHVDVGSSRVHSWGTTKKENDIIVNTKPKSELLYSTSGVIVDLFFNVI